MSIIDDLESAEFALSFAEDKAVRAADLPADDEGLPERERVAAAVERAVQAVREAIRIVDG